MQNDVDVYIIQKQTTLERYTKHNLKFNFYDYLIKDKQTPAPLQFAHNAHVKTRDILLKSLDTLGLSYKLFHLDDLLKNTISYFDDEIVNSGLKPKRNLVISLGGDGTLLHASHHVGGDVCLLGINSCPEHSIGHLCPVTPNHIESALKCFINQEFNTKSLRRLKLSLSRKASLPLALNDVLLCNKHPAATSRYQLSVYNHIQKEEQIQEKQLSSGLWIATAAGSTAAIASYGFEEIALDSPTIHIAVREPYTPRNEKFSLQKGRLNGNENSITFFSRMRQGLVCVDGPDSCAHLGFGDTVQLSLPEKCSLKLILDFFGKVPTFPFDQHK